MNENEKIRPSESQQSEEEIVKSWLAELDREIKIKEKLLRLTEDPRRNEPGHVIQKLITRAKEELPGLRRTRQEYEGLLKEARAKKP